LPCPAWPLLYPSARVTCSIPHVSVAGSSWKSFSGEPPTEQQCTVHTGALLPVFVFIFPEPSCKFLRAGTHSSFLFLISFLFFLIHLFSEHYLGKTGLVYILQPRKASRA
jgi:hypothetical protein